MITCKPGVRRDLLVKYIEGHGIQTRMLFAGNLIKHPCFDQMRKLNSGYRVAGTLSNTDDIMQNSFWVGVYPGMTDAKISCIAKTILDGLNAVK